MSSSEKLTLTWALLAAILERTKGPIPYEPRVFAQVVEELRETNLFAARYQVLNRLDGPHPPGFVEGMDHARAAGLIARGVPSYNHFTILMSYRVAGQYLRWSGDPSAVQAVADRYLERLGLLTK